MIALDTIYTIEVQFAAIPNIWAAVEATIQEGLEAIKTGILRGQIVERVKIASVTTDDGSAIFVYDIKAAKQGVQPWSLL